MCRADLWMTVNLRLELRRDGGEADRVSAKLRPSIPGLGMMMDCLHTSTLLVFMTDVDPVDILSQCRYCSCPYPGPPCKVRTLVARGRPNVGAVAAPVGPQLSQQLVLGAQPTQEAALSTVNTLSRLLKTVEICQQCQHPPRHQRRVSATGQWGNWR